MISINLKKPEPGQKITATILYQGKKVSINGIANETGNCIFFDFYNAVVDARIIEWEPRK